MIYTVDVDYSQFSLLIESDAFEMDDYDAPEFAAGLARVDRHGQVMFVLFRQFGPMAIDVEVVTGKPQELGPEWQDIVEFSVAPAGELQIDNWGGFEGVGIGTIPGRSYRVQYAVSDADLAETTEGGEQVERYRVRLWPEEAGPAQVVRNESAAAQYWTYQQGAVRALGEVSELEPGTRTTAIIDIALREHPETARRIREGNAAYRSGVIAYAQKIYPHELEHDAVERLIDERAAGLV